MKVVIAGGGVMGWATALFLGRMGLGASVRVVETGGDSLLCSSTSRSAGGIRHQFTNEENVRMSLFGTHFLRSLQSIGPATDCQFHERGYLFLAGSAAGAETLRQSNLVQRQCGAQVALLNPSELSRRWPFLHLDDILLAGFGEQGEGWLDPHLLRSSMRQLAMDLGVQQVKATVARGILQRNHVTGVELDSGQVLPCDAVVNALGASCASFMESMDPMFYLPVRRRKRTIFYFECRQPLPNMPMIINTDGTYVRPEGSGYIAGGAESAGPEPDVEAGDFDPAEHLWEERLWESLASRVPAFESVKVQSVWAGHYEYNTVDQNAIIGLTPLADNLYLINGFSGHGLQQAPAAGRAVAELIATGSFQTIDLSRLGYSRLLPGGEPVFEKNII